MSRSIKIVFFTILRRGHSTARSRMPGSGRQQGARGLHGICRCPRPPCVWLCHPTPPSAVPLLPGGQRGLPDYGGTAGEVSQRGVRPPLPSSLLLPPPPAPLITGRPEAKWQFGPQWGGSAATPSSGGLLTLAARWAPPLARWGSGGHGVSPGVGAGGSGGLLEAQVRGGGRGAAGEADRRAGARGPCSNQRRERRSLSPRWGGGRPRRARCRRSKGGPLVKKKGVSTFEMVTAASQQAAPLRGAPRARPGRRLVKAARAVCTPSRDPGSPGRLPGLFGPCRGARRKTTGATPPSSPSDLPFRPGSGCPSRAKPQPGQGPHRG